MTPSSYIYPNTNRVVALQHMYARMTEGMVVIIMEITRAEWDCHMGYNGNASCSNDTAARTNCKIYAPFYKYYWV